MNQAEELGCYLETAWQGAAWSFKSPPKKNPQAKLVMVNLLSLCQLETNAMTNH